MTKASTLKDLQSGVQTLNNSSNKLKNSTPQSKVDIGKSIQEDSQSEFDKSNQQSNLHSNLTDQINDTSEILNVNLMNARMQVDEINNINYETIKKKKYLNLMGKKCDYDVRSESNVYKSRPQTNNTNYRNTESKNTMNISRSMHKLDSLHDLSNIKQ